MTGGVNRATWGPELNDRYKFTWARDTFQSLWYNAKGIVFKHRWMFLGTTPLVLASRHLYQRFDSRACGFVSYCNSLLDSSTDYVMMATRGTSTCIMITGTLCFPLSLHSTLANRNCLCFSIILQAYTYGVIRIFVSAVKYTGFYSFPQPCARWSLLRLKRLPTTRVATFAGSETRIHISFNYDMHDMYTLNHSHLNFIHTPCSCHSLCLPHRPSILVVLLHRTIMPGSLKGGYIKLEGELLHTTFVSISWS